VFQPNTELPAWVDTAALFVLQALMIPLFDLVLTVAFGGCIGPFARKTSPFIFDSFVVIALVSPIALAFCLGYGICTVKPKCYSAARLAWILPTACLGCMLVSSVAKYSLRITVRDFLGPGLLLLFVTLPSLACCLYSVGAALAHRRKLERQSDMLN
jgi:hypothetical protein